MERLSGSVWGVSIYLATGKGPRLIGALVGSWGYVRRALLLAPLIAEASQRELEEMLGRRSRPGLNSCGELLRKLPESEPPRPDSEADG